ncbi:hypothetical protein FRB95_011441 [Tulasnella sp. JGI-2019a]|nr:hypothetical protein FRB95_011441 [Tulasnella sp. JGI-2019a]
MRFQPFFVLMAAMGWLSTITAAPLTRASNVATLALTAGSSAFGTQCTPPDHPNPVTSELGAPGGGVPTKENGKTRVALSEMIDTITATSTPAGILDMTIIMHTTTVTITLVDTKAPLRGYRED